MKMTDEDHNASDMGRRAVLQTAGVAVIVGLAAGSTLDEDVADPSALTEETHIRLFGVVVPNDDRVGFEWAGFRTPFS